MSERYAGPIVDAHHHIWDLGGGRHPWLAPGARVPHRYGDYEAIKHDYLPSDYLADIEGSGVVASVYMEAEWDPADPIGETEAIHAAHAASGVPGAMAAQAWLDAPDVAEVLARQAAFPLVRSVRHKPGGAATPAEAASGVRTLMSDEAWRSGYALLSAHGLHFELQTPWWNLGEARALADDFPSTTIVVNHAGVVADRSPETLAGWRSAVEHVAGAPNVVIKASGLCVAGEPWTVDLNRGVVLDMVRVFGPDRVMFGSNFPVDAMFVGYRELVDGYRDILSALDVSTQRAVLHDTAERVYHPIPLP